MKIIYILITCWITALVGCASDASNKNIEELTKKASAGDRVAQRRLGMAYDFDVSKHPNYVEAARWYQLAADQGDAISQNNLGSLYEHGLGVSQDYAKSLEFYRKSAEQRFAMAQNSLGRMYCFGMGVATNYVEANKWYLKAAEQGDAQAMFNLGSNYVFGRGVSKDRVQAFMWLDMARFFTQQSPDMKTKWTIRRAYDDLQEYMTSEEIQQGKRLSRDWYDDYLARHKQAKRSSSP